VTGSPVAKVIHNFGRADKVDREALRRLVASISRFLELTEATAEGSEVEIVDARRFGGAYVLDELWHRLGIARALHLAATDRRLDGETVERVLFALVAQRCLEPDSKLACVSWARERVALSSCPDFDDQAAYAAMDFLLDALSEIATGIFNRTANLLNLSCDVIFVDTSSTYWELDVADEEIELAGAIDAEQAKTSGGTEPVVPDEAVLRPFSNNSKDHRTDLPQVVIAMAVTADGVPIRCWTFPGKTSDQLVIRRIKDDLGSWMLNRILWVTDSGFIRHQPRLPARRWRSLHRLRVAPLGERGREGCPCPPRPLPPGRGEPPGEGGARRRRRPRTALLRLCEPRSECPRRDRARQPRRLPGAPDRQQRRVDQATPRRARR
jgi:hypothetical protein